jgi:hypothetical protein
MKELDIQDLPPTAKLEALQARELIRGQILQELERSRTQTEQREQMQQKLLRKYKRRARRQQKRKH